MLGFTRRRSNRDRRNAAGGLGCGERTVRRGGWLRFGDDLFYSPRLASFAGQRVFISNLSDAFSPETASCQIVGLDGWVTLDNVYHLACRGVMPPHLEFLRERLGRLS